MKEAKVVNILHEEYDIYIGRHSDPVKGKWGNPFSHKNNSLANYKTNSRKESLEKYKKYILNNEYLLDQIEELRGKKLGCFCKPKKCHGDILVEILKSKPIF